MKKYKDYNYVPSSESDSDEFELKTPFKDVTNNYICKNAFEVQFPENLDKKSLLKKTRN